MRRLTVVLAAGIVGAALATGTGALVVAQQDTLIKQLMPPMLTVAKLVAQETWNPRFDELVQKFPAAAPLGDKWNRSQPGFLTARSAVGARLTRILDLYSRSGELTRALQTGLDKYFPGAEADALHRVLIGPDGPVIMRYEAEAAFLYGVPSGGPNAPQPGDPAWMAEVGKLIKKARAGLDPFFPPRDAKREEAAAKFSNEPLGRQFGNLWRTVLDRANGAIDGAINLMLFDDREAIGREITQAIATVK